MTPAQTIAAALDAVRITSREYAALHSCTERRVKDWRLRARADDEGRVYKRTSRIAPPTDDDARRVVEVCATLAKESVACLQGLSGGGVRCGR